MEFSIAGEWQFYAGSKTAYEADQQPVISSIELPGSVTERGFGTENPRQEKLFLTERRRYTGKALFWKTLELDVSDRQQVFLTLERSRKTTLWVNGHCAGSRDLLTSTQCYEISALVQRGQNVLMIECDNTFEGMPAASIFGSHMATEHTQTNWNGIVGAMKIRILPAAAWTSVQVFPNIAAKSAHLRLILQTKDSYPQNACLTVCASSGQLLKEEKRTVRTGECWETTVQLPSDTPLWSEFDPQLTELTLRMETEGGMQTETVRFGLREFTIAPDHRHFQVNGKSVFLRSETNCAVFPLTGYAPMDRASWDHLMDVYQSFGVNHVRFHSWCPPEAAFEAADERGILIQAELCEWTFHTFEDDAEYDYYTRETQAILQTYGRHPSLVSLTWGNELRSGRRDRMSELIFRMHQEDPTRLYAEGSNTWYGEIGYNPDSDFLMTQSNEGSIFRGACAGNKGHINEQRPGERVQYSDMIRPIPMPVVSFEVGQFQVYPDYRETDLYTGVLEARNLQQYRQMLEERGLAGRDRAFHADSGRLAMRCYREEIEAALRTPELAGISLLSLQDFSGQGTALVGMMNAFGEAKSFVRPEEFRSFFNSVVPLLCFDHYVFRSGEEACFTLKVSQFGPDDLCETARIRLEEEDGSLIGEWCLEGAAAPQGTLCEIGSLCLKMPETDHMKVIRATASFGSRSNVYSLYVYPQTVLTEEEKKRLIYRLDGAAVERLKAGESLVLLPACTPEALPASLPASYITDFWCWAMFQKYDPSGTMGFCLNPEDPLFRDFPTASSTDPRWWQLLHGARAMVVTGQKVYSRMPMIDNLQRNQELSVCWEARVGKGRILVCSLAFEEEGKYPEADCLRAALCRYMAGDTPNDLPVLSPEELKRLLPCHEEVNFPAPAAYPWFCAMDEAIELNLSQEKMLDCAALTFASGSAYNVEGTVCDVPGRICIFCREGQEWKAVSVLYQSPVSEGPENVTYFEPVKTDAVRILLSTDASIGVAMAMDEGGKKTVSAIEAIRLFALPEEEI